ncbi:MAG: glycosyltransferase family 39 protein [Pseudomonadota bacterium]
MNDFTNHYSRFAFPTFAATAILVAVVLGWVGFYGSDDLSYAAGGYGWLNDLPYVGVNHWTLRHTIVVPMAALFGIFGVSEVTLVLPVTLQYLALLALVFWLMQRYFDTTAACIAALILGTLPLTAVAASTVVPDFAEVFFCLLSLALFYEATRRERRTALLLLAGVAAGFGWLTRETVVFFLLTYGVLFLAGYSIPRRQYFVMAVGFLAVVGIEFLYFTAMTGNPLYRIHTDLATHLGGDIIGSDKTASGLERALAKVEGELYGPLSRTGSFSVSRFLDPILVILANQEFMLLYYLAVPAALWTAIKRPFTGSGGRMLAVFGLAGAIWFLCLYLQIGMTLLPRYYLLPTVALIMVFAAWLRMYLWERSPALAVALLIAMFSSHLLGIYVDNRNPIFGERALVEYLKQTDEIVHTDPETARRGGFLYKLAGVENRVVAAPPKAGEPFFYNPAYVAFGSMAQNRQKLIEQLSPYKPQESWPLIWHKEPEHRHIGVVIDFLGLRDRLPAEIYRRLVTPNFPVAVYRVQP